MNYIEQQTAQILESINEFIILNSDSAHRIESCIQELYNTSWGWLGQSLEDNTVPSNKGN